MIFERATAFSAVVCLIVFGILGNKYLEFMEARNPANPTSAITTQ